MLPPPTEWTRHGLRTRLRIQEARGANAAAGLADAFHIEALRSEQTAPDLATRGKAESPEIANTELDVEPTAQKPDHTNVYRPMILNE
eukprot:scaffold74445_cov40-Prasinocladus_malaysianus.AAC.1